MSEHPNSKGQGFPVTTSGLKVSNPTRRFQDTRGWYSRGYLPHFDHAALVQHITFHLADSLPQSAIARMQAKFESMSPERQSVERRKRIQILLDRGLGCCSLGHGPCAKIVEDSLLFGDGDRYRLLAWVVMPNHVHVPIQQLEGWPLARVVQSWKRHTSREIHRAHDAPTTASPLWQRDYWDRFIRDSKHFMAARNYIEQNPVMASLVTTAQEWPWGSARFGGKN